jgi:orotate phosphoribosyltransferase
MANGTKSFSPQADRAARALQDAGALIVAADVPNQATWPTYRGSRAPASLDVSRCFGDAGTAAILSVALANSVRVTFPGASALVGLGVLGLAWAARVSAELGLAFGYVDSPGAHHQAVIVPFADPAKIVLIGGLLGAGEDVEQATKLLRERHSFQIVGYQCVITAGERAAWERENRLGISFARLTGIDRLLAESARRGELSGDLVRELTLFFSSPDSHEWDLQGADADG